MSLPSRLTQLLREHERLADWAGPASPRQIEAAEATLGVRFPDGYRGFLAAYGSGLFGKADVCGIARAGDKFWDVVWRTLQERTAGSLDAAYAVIGDDGQGNSYCLDCGSGAVVWVTPLVSGSERIEEPVAPTFAHYLLELVNRQLELGQLLR